MYMHDYMYLCDKWKAQTKKQNNDSGNDSILHVQLYTQWI